MRPARAALALVLSLVCAPLGAAQGAPDGGTPPPRDAAADAGAAAAIPVPAGCVLSRTQRVAHENAAQAIVRVEAAAAVIERVQGAGEAAALRARANELRARLIADLERACPARP